MFSKILFLIYIINIKIYILLKQHVAYNVNNTHIPPSKNVIIQHNDFFTFAIYMKKHNTNNTQFPHPKISSFNTIIFSCFTYIWKSHHTNNTQFPHPKTSSFNTTTFSYFAISSNNILHSTLL